MNRLTFLKLLGITVASFFVKPTIDFSSYDFPSYENWGEGIIRLRTDTMKLYGCIVEDYGPKPKNIYIDKAKNVIIQKNWAIFK